MFPAFGIDELFGSAIALTLTITMTMFIAHYTNIFSYIKCKFYSGTGQRYSFAILSHIYTNSYKHVYRHHLYIT